MSNNQSNELETKLTELLTGLNNYRRTEPHPELVEFIQERERRLRLELSAAKIRESELLDEIAPYRAMKEQIKGE